jgi:hypothetical protein
MQPAKEQHFRGYADCRNRGQNGQGLVHAGRTRARLQSSSRTLIASQAPWGIALSEGTVCSELESFHTAPAAVCKARRI